MKADGTGLTSEKLRELAARMARDLEQVAEIAPAAGSRAQVMQIAAGTRRIAEIKSVPDAVSLPPLSDKEVETRLAELRASLARDRNNWLLGHWTPLIARAGAPGRRPR